MRYNIALGQKGFSASSKSDGYLYEKSAVSRKYYFCVDDKKGYAKGISYNGFCYI